MEEAKLAGTQRRRDRGRRTMDPLRCSVDAGFGKSRNPVFFRWKFGQGDSIRLKKFPKVPAAGGHVVRRPRYWAAALPTVITQELTRNVDLCSDAIHTSIMRSDRMARSSCCLSGRDAEGRPCTEFCSPLEFRLARSHFELENPLGNTSESPESAAIPAVPSSLENASPSNASPSNASSEGPILPALPSSPPAGEGFTAAGLPVLPPSSVGGSFAAPAVSLASSEASTIPASEASTIPAVPSSVGGSVASPALHYASSEVSALTPVPSCVGDSFASPTASCSSGSSSQASTLTPVPSSFGGSFYSASSTGTRVSSPDSHWDFRTPPPPQSPPAILSHWMEPDTASAEPVALLQSDLPRVRVRQVLLLGEDGVSVPQEIGNAAEEFLRTSSLPAFSREFPVEIPRSDFKDGLLPVGVTDGPYHSIPVRLHRDVAANGGDEYAWLRCLTTQEEAGVAGSLLQLPAERFLGEISPRSGSLARFETSATGAWSWISKTAVEIERLKQEAQARYPLGVSSHLFEGDLPPAAKFRLSFPALQVGTARCFLGLDVDRQKAGQQTRHFKEVVLAEARAFQDLHGYGPRTTKDVYNRRGLGHWEDLLGRIIARRVLDTSIQCHLERYEPVQIEGEEGGIRSIRLWDQLKRMYWHALDSFVANALRS